MSDDPSEADLEEIRRLKSLSPLFRKGWEKQHPIPENNRAIVEKVFSKPLEERQKEFAKAELEKDQRIRAEQEVEKEQSEQSQTKDQGPSHSH